MAKMKMYAVDIEATKTVTVYVDARRPNGAVERLQTDEGWQEATRHDYDDALPSRFDEKTMKVTQVRLV